MKFETAFAAAIGTASLFVALPANDIEKKILFINKTGKPITAFCYSNPNANNWEEDATAAVTIAADASFEASIDEDSDNCVYDFKIVFASGGELMKPGVNICECPSFTYRE